MKDRKSTINEPTDVQVLDQNEKKHKKQDQIYALITNYIVMPSNENTFKNLQTKI